jgi:hypothetical protein
MLEAEIITQREGFPWIQLEAIEVGMSDLEE